jgi:hypothetical protein
MAPPWHTATPCHVWKNAYHNLGKVSEVSFSELFLARAKLPALTT